VWRNRGKKKDLAASFRKRLSPGELAKALARQVLEKIGLAQPKTLFPTFPQAFVPTLLPTLPQAFVEPFLPPLLRPPLGRFQQGLPTLPK